jgi:hypothetical protein
VKKKPLVKYVGKYRELIPIGYTFHKLYANNYRTYQKEFKGEYSIWIFVARNSFEIESLFDNSGWLIRCLIKNRKIIDKVLFHGNLWAILNTETGEVTRLDEGQEALEHRRTKDKAYETRIGILMTCCFFLIRFIDKCAYLCVSRYNFITSVKS